MNTTTLFCIIFVAVSLAGCGGSSGSETTDTTVPISVNISNAPLSAAVPATFTYNIPAPAKPYSDVTVDLAKTLESASITITTP